MAERKFLVDLDIDGKLTSSVGYAVSGGTSSGFLKADGTIDSTSYASPSIFSVASESAQLALSTVKGDVVVRTDENKSYMHNGLAPGGTELITYPNFSSVAYPWNYGSWSNATPTTDGTTATIEVDSVGYPKVLQEIVTVAGSTYNVKFSVNTDSNDFELVAKTSGFTTILSSGVINNSTMEEFTMTFDATTTGTIIELALGGQSGTTAGGISVGDTVTMTEVSVKLSDGMAKYTHFASL